MSLGLDFDKINIKKKFEDGGKMKLFASAGLISTDDQLIGRKNLTTYERNTISSFIYLMPFFRGNQFTSVSHSAVLFVCSVLDHRHDAVKIFKKNIPDLTSQRGVCYLFSH